MVISFYKHIFKKANIYDGLSIARKKTSPVFVDITDFFCRMQLTNGFVVVSNEVESSIVNSVRVDNWTTFFYCF